MEEIIDRNRRVYRSKDAAPNTGASLTKHCSVTYEVYVTNIDGLELASLLPFNMGSAALVIPIRSY